MSTYSDRIFADKNERVAVIALAAPKREFDKRLGLRWYTLDMTKAFWIMVWPCQENHWHQKAAIPINKDRWFVSLNVYANIYASLIES